MMLVYCNSNTDCEVIIGANVCKETIYGGAKTCQPSTSCTQICSSGEYCDASNICHDGKFEFNNVINSC